MLIKPWFVATSLLVLAGCSHPDSTDPTAPDTSPVSMDRVGKNGGHEAPGPLHYSDASPHDPGGAPNWALGQPMGNGFRDLTANQAGGMGTGLQGFNDVGAAGTSGAITDTHHAVPGDQSSAGGGRSTTDSPTGM